MELQNLSDQSSAGQRVHTLRDLVAVLFRHNRLMAIAALGILSGAVVLAVLQPSHYRSQMKILIKRERLDPVVSPQSSTTSQVSATVTEEELNSEVDLLTSNDVLEKVVTGCDLQKKKSGFWGRLFSFPSIGTSAETQAAKERAEIAAAADKLKKDLKVGLVKKTNLISVEYESSDANLAARVLNTLASAYQEKHVEVHRLPAALDFFQQEAERYRAGLVHAEAALVDSTKDGAVSAQQQKDATLQKLTEFEASARQTQESISETEERIRTLQTQIKSTPTRLVTQIKDSDDSALLSQLRASLLTLELKRTELLMKFEPTYRPVQEVDAQIAENRTSLEAAEKSKLREETTDQDPTYAWLVTEMAKAKTDLAGFQARAAALAQAIDAYRNIGRQLEQKEIMQSDLLRDVKTGEQNYLLYLQKEEEARISDALDRRRIVNVAIAEPPMVPSLPSNPGYLTVLIGGIFAVFASVGTAFAFEHMDSTLRTPDEVKSFLEVPVLASIPKKATNGNHRSNGTAPHAAKITTLET